jgi:hypothetical protein
LTPHFFSALALLDKAVPHSANLVTNLDEEYLAIKPYYFCFERFAKQVTTTNPEGSPDYCERPNCLLEASLLSLGNHYLSSTLYCIRLHYFLKHR